MFITPQELKTVLYDYQRHEITEADNTITLQAIAAAEEEMRSYLMPNKYTNYDVEAIFSATGNDRNPLIVEHTKNLAVYYLVRLANVDMLYEHVKERYDRTIDFMKQVNQGKITLGLPRLSNTGSGSGNEDTGKPFRSGSRPKFNHDFI
ncbi:MAG: DUF1320 domain-containing protein [Chitinophagaceae bacterium]|nr:DUF1320 domain-containing protein [Chitinophagaceae bacterium]